MGAAAHGLAVDLGASSGRVFLASFDGGRIELEAVHRFPNGGVRSEGRLRWLAGRIFDEILLGAASGAARAEGPIEAISVDAWGVDFGLLDGGGRLLADPVHYRDDRTIGVPERADSVMSAEELYRRTGIPPLRINTLYQLLSEPQQLEGAESLLFVPDLMHRWLSGSVCSEPTIASTSQLLAASGAGWDREVLDRFDIPAALMPPIVAAGTDLGPLTKGAGRRAGLAGTRVVMPAAHDTASAALGVPREPGRAAAWVSSGTWSIVGIDSAGPVRSKQALRAQISNEPAPGGGTSVTRNVMGMWLLQECRREWAASEGLSEAELIELAGEEPPSPVLIDPDDPSFLAPGAMPTLIRRAAGGAGNELTRPGALVRCVLESLAAKTKWALDSCAAAAGASYEAVHVVGGGSEIALLNQLIADFTERSVIAGPQEAAVLGIAAVQLLGTGRLGDWGEVAQVVRASSATTVFEPAESDIPASSTREVA